MIERTPFNWWSINTCVYGGGVGIVPTCKQTHARARFNGLQIIYIGNRNINNIDCHAGDYTKTDIRVCRCRINH